MPWACKVQAGQCDWSCRPDAGCGVSLAASSTATHRVPVLVHTATQARPGLRWDNSHCEMAGASAIARTARVAIQVMRRRTDGDMVEKCKFVHAAVKPRSPRILGFTRGRA